MRNVRTVLFLIALGSIAFATQAATEANLRKRVARLAESLSSMQIEEHTRIPGKILAEAKGIVLLRQYEAGFIFGGKGGVGIAMIRDEYGRWGPPSWLKTGEGSWGLQAGVQKLNVAILIMNDDFLHLLTRSKFRIGVDATATAGPTGANIEAKAGLEAPILIYTDTEGLFAGASFEGGFMFPNHKANTTTYGLYLQVEDILHGNGVDTPDLIRPVIAKLESIERE